MFLKELLINTIPGDEALARLRDNSLSIAQNLGQSANELVEGGFLDEDDVADLQSLAELEDEGFTDPRLENQLSDERARLEQDLRRQGASPATRAQALSEFDRRSEESRFTRAEELRSGRFQRTSGRIQLRSGLRQSNLQRALSGFGATQSAIDQARAGITQAGGLAQARFQGTGAASQLRSGLRQERLGAFQSLGQFDFSGRVQEFLRRGEIGPGSLPGTQGLSRGPSSQLVDKNQFSRLSNEDLLNRARSLQQGPGSPQQSPSGLPQGNRRQRQDLQSLFAEIGRRGIG